jgi:hypothetical protein
MLLGFSRVLLHKNRYSRLLIKNNNILAQLLLSFKQSQKRFNGVNNPPMPSAKISFKIPKRSAQMD